MPMRSRLLFFRHVAVATGLAVSALAEPAPPADRPAEASVSVVAEIPLQFSARGQRLPVPLIAAKLYGTEGLLIVDTGSSHQAVARAFADSHHLASTPEAAGHDHAGNTVATQHAGTGEWQIGPEQRTVTDAVIVPGPAAFAPLGIHGFLSPQNFFTAGYLVFDFPAGKLIVLKPAPAATLRPWLKTLYPTRPLLELPRATDAALDPRKIYVHAALGDHSPVVAELDTGGSVTEFDESLLPPVAASDATTTTSTASGKTNTARTVEGQTIHLAGHAFGPMKIKRHLPRPGVQALLGIDLLRQTVLIVPLDPTAPLWLLPSEH